MNTIWPVPLPRGGTVGVCALSSYVDPARLNAAARTIEAQGYKVFLHPQASARLDGTQNASSVAGKTAALDDLLKNPDVGAIILAGGGNFALHLLDRIDYALIAKAKKPIMGFSDATALLNAIAAKTGLVTWHGPMMNWIAAHETSPYVAGALRGIGGDMQPVSFEGADIVQAGTAQGRLWGGNLSLLQCLAGTPYAIPGNDLILFVEDINIELSVFDRALRHLYHTGLPGRANALIVGDMVNLTDTGRPFGYTARQVVENLVKDIGFQGPVIMNAPFGHGDALAAFPVGAMARYDAGRLSFLP